MKRLLATFGPSVLQKQLKGYLLYGHHAGLQQGAIEEIIACMPCTILKEEAFLADPGHFMAPTLFAPPQDKIFIISEVGEKSLSLYLPYFQETTHIFIFTSATFTTASSWVQHFSKSPQLASIACYEGCAKQSAIILTRYLKRAGLTLEPEVFTICAELTKEGTWQSTVDLLRMVPGTIRLEDLAHLLPEVEQATASLLAPSVPEVYQSLKALEALADFLKVIRGWQKVLLQLWQLRTLIQQGRPAEEAIKAVAPPFFFKYAPAALQRIPIWTHQKLCQAMQLLHQAEIAAKEGYTHTATQLLMTAYQLGRS